MIVYRRRRPASADAAVGRVPATAVGVGVVQKQRLELVLHHACYFEVGKNYRAKLMFFFFGWLLNGEGF